MNLSATVLRDLEIANFVDSVSGWSLYYYDAMCSVMSIILIYSSIVH